MSVFFSIIIPTYNRAAFLEKAIESLIIQTFTNWELIVVDDGSTDSTKEMVEKYKHQDNRIKYRYQNNAERCAARNNGVSVAEGEYVCFLDSDDYFLAERLSLLYKAILEMNTPTALCYTDILKQGDGKIETQSYPDNKYKNVFDLLLDRTIHSQQICCATSILKEFRYDTRFIIGEDKELWLRIATMYPVIYIPFQATVVIVEHNQRTVGAKKPSGYEKQIETYNFIKEEHKRNFSSRRIINTGIHDSYMGLARSYMYNGRNWMMLWAIFVGSTYCFSRTGKGKIYLIVSNFSIFKPLLWLYRLIKKKKI